MRSLALDEGVLVERGAAAAGRGVEGGVTSMTDRVGDGPGGGSGSDGGGDGAIVVGSVCPPGDRVGL